MLKDHAHESTQNALSMMLTSTTMPQNLKKMDEVGSRYPGPLVH